MAVLAFHLVVSDKRSGNPSKHTQVQYDVVNILQYEVMPFIA